MATVDTRSVLTTQAGAEAAGRRIWLCADDYGISPAVSRGIRELVQGGRLNATSVMVAAPSMDRGEAEALDRLNSDTRRVAIGLHVTLTAPFQPRHEAFLPLRDSAFLTFEQLLMRGSMRTLRPAIFAAEVLAQLQGFVDLFGRAPDFIDGHQHVHLFPQVRGAVLQTAKEIAPEAWVRQCGRALPLIRRFADRKGLVLDVLSRQMRRHAEALGIATNPAFAGTYDFAIGDADFAALFPTFLDRLPAHSVVMCHPGFVDDELRRLDPLTGQREREYAFLASDAFPRVLQAHGVSLA